MIKIFTLTFLFFSTHLFSQYNISVDSTELNYAVQIFSSTDEQSTINEASTLLDVNIIEKISKNMWRVIILARDKKQAEEILQVYRESYQDCFILECKNNKKIN